MKTHQKCPSCGHNDCATVWDDGRFFCHSCGGKQAKPSEGYEEKDTTPSDLTFEYREYRGIKKEICEKYNILTGINADGEEVSRVYPYPHRPKTRILPKDFTQNKGFTNDHFLGLDFFNAGSSKKITIVEGEDDWGSTIQMLGDKWPVFCLPGSGTAKKVLQNPKCYEALSQYSSIIIATDGDEAGDGAAADIQKAFPGKSYRVNMNLHSDPNEYLQAGDADKFMYAWINAKKYVPDNVLNTTDQFMKMYGESVEHLHVPTGINSLDEKILGIMQGHFTVIKAPTGIGKTEFMRYLEYSFLKQGVPIAAWHLEEIKKRTLLGLVSYELKDNVTRQDIINDKKKDVEVAAAISELTKDENFYQFFLGDLEGANELIEQIRYFREVCGVRYVFFEPIQDVITSGSDESKEAALADLSIRLSKLAASIGVGIVTIAHTNDNGDPKYCKMIGQRASVIIDLSRNKDSEDEDENNTMYIKVEKNRPTSLEGAAGCMLFELESFTLKEKLLPF